MEENLITEELVIVGSRYGGLADVLKPYYEKGEPIDTKNIEKLLGSTMVYLQPTSNNNDKYAVGVFLLSEVRLGYVWKDQSYPLYEWMQNSNKTLHTAEIKRIISRHGIIIAEIELPFRLQDCVRQPLDLDMDWANNLPGTMVSVEHQSLHLSFSILTNELPDETAWSESLKKRFENLRRNLPADLSAQNIEDSIKLWNMMKCSPIKEVRALRDDILNDFVSRGSEKMMKRWVTKSLPKYLSEIIEADFIRLFEMSNYTLERVEELLNRAPNNLFHLYKYSREMFAFHLYYTSLPDMIYRRLLTLLAVREGMLGKMRGVTEQMDGRKLPTAVIMANAVEQTMNEGLWYGATGWAVVYRVYQIAGYKGSYSEFVREAKAWPWSRTIDYLPTDDAVSKPLRNGKMMTDIKYWEAEGVAKRNRMLAMALLQKMGFEIS